MSYMHPTPPPKQGMSTGSKAALFGCGGLVVIGALLFGGCAVIGGAVLNETDKAIKKDAKEDKRAAREDVELLSCEIVDVDFIGLDVKAKVKITNHGKQRANYYVEGEFVDQDGNQIEGLLAAVNNLAPGSSSTQDFAGAFGSEELKNVTKGKCKILDVTRDEWSAAN